MRKVVINTLVFIAGFTTVFSLLGATASFLGQYLTYYKTTINMVGGVLVIILGLHLAGVFRIGFLEYEKRFQMKGKPLGVIGSYLIGAAFAFGWTPCIGPILSSILMIAANQNTIMDGVFLLVTYSLGLGIPFLITGIALNYALSFFKIIKRNYRTVELISGILLILIGVLMATNQFTRISAFMSGLSGETTAEDVYGKATIVTAFSAGFLSFISPCVLPLVPAYISYISGVSIDALKGDAEQPPNPA
jgi:cytochrome c-type biogenesis protein